MPSKVSASGASATQDPPSAFTISVTPQYMENHRPAALIGADSPLDTAITSDGQPIVFSLDDGGNLMATVATDNTPQQGWALYNISTPVMQSYSSNYKPAGVAFAVSQDSGSSIADSSSSGLTPGNISIVLTVSVTNVQNADSWTEVWVLSDVSPDSNAPWLANPAGWTKPSTSGTGLGSQVSVQDTRALRFNSAGVNYQALEPMGVVHVQSGTQLVPYLVPMSGSGEWEALNVEHAYSQLISGAVGRTAYTAEMDGHPINGFYKIVVPVGETAPVTSFTCNSTGSATVFDTVSPTALGTVPSSYEGQLATDLFVVDGSTLLYFACDAKGPTPSSAVPGEIVLESPILTGCSELHCSTDGNVVSIYGLANGVIFHTQASYANRGSASAWNTPLPLLTAVTKAAMHISEGRGLTSIFAIQAAGTGLSYQQNGLTVEPPPSGSGNATVLVEMHKDHLTSSGHNHWRKRRLHLPDDTNFLTLQTYTHTVKIVDQYANPAANTPVLITAQSTVVLEVNNQCVTVTAAAGATVNTDLRGCLEILQDASTPAVTQLTFTATALEATPAVTVDATAQTSADINTYANAAASNPKAVTAQAWCTKSSSDLQTAQGFVGTLSSTKVPPPSTAIEPRTASSENPVEAFFGDIWQAICEGFADIGSLIIKAVDGVTSVFINIGQWLYTAVLETAEDVCAALSAVIQFLGAGLEDLFQWLAFLFDWETIIANQESIFALQSAMVTAMPKVAAGALGTLADWLDHFAKNLSPISGKLPQTSVNTQNQAVQGQTTNSSTGVSSSDPRMSWGQSQVQPPGTSGGSGQSGDSSSSLTGAVAAFVEEVGSDVSSLLQSNISFSQFAATLENDALKLIANILTAGADWVTNMEGTVATLMEEMLAPLTATLNIPLFSSLFQEATKCSEYPDGENLTLLGLIALLEAVPITFIYGLVGKQSTTFLDQKNLDFLLNAVQNLDTYFAGPSETAARAKTGVGSASSGADTGGVISMMYILSLTRIVRGVTTYLLGEAEEAWAVPALTTAMRWDNAVWVFEGVSELLLSAALESAGDHIESSVGYLMGGVNTGFAICSLANCFSSNKLSAKLEAAATFSAVVGALEAIAAIIESDSPDTQENLDLVAGFVYGANEVFEFFQNQWESCASVALKGRLVLIGLSVIADVISATMLLTGTGTGTAAAAQPA